MEPRGGCGHRCTCTFIDIVLYRLGRLKGTLLVDCGRPRLPSGELNEVYKNAQTDWGALSLYWRETGRAAEAALKPSTLRGFSAIGHADPPTAALGETACAEW